MSITVIDQAGYYTPTDLAEVVGAIQHQITSHVGPLTGYGFRSVHVGTTAKGGWPVYILQNPDVAGALGYHDLDPNGQPYGRVFVEPTVQAGVSVSSVLSHEIVEAYCDPDANLWADRQNGVSVAFEACDPVEASSYEINGVEVSNFVTRAWFDPTLKSGRFDYLEHLSAPLTLEKGGYEILMTDGKVSQSFGDDYPDWRLALKSAPQPSRTRWRGVRTLVDG
jgi:hypothetical protein